MKISHAVQRFVRRPFYVLAATAVGMFTALPLLVSPYVSAGGQVQSRFVQLSNSANNANGGTNVTYNVSFKPTSTATIGGIVVDFCNESPLIGSTTCTNPSGFTMGTSVTVTGLSGIPTSGWVTSNSLQCGAAASNKAVLLYTNPTPQAPTGSSTPINFQITGVTNPTSNGTVYVRILTFDTSANTVSQYTCGTATTRPASFANMVDYGGAAISIANVIQITATVQETLTFCVSKAAPGTGCSGTTSPILTLGNGGSPSILDSGGPYTDTAYTQITTNAVGNVAVNMKSNNTCTGLSRDAGATCPIAGMGAFAAMTAGTGKFGLLVANGSGGTGTVAANGNYGTTAGSYGMGTNVTTTYGDTIESTSGATKDVNSLLTFAATAQTTTPAGVYTANESLIATGTF